MPDPGSTGGLVEGAQLQPSPYSCWDGSCPVGPAVRPRSSQKSGHRHQIGISVSPAKVQAVTCTRAVPVTTVKKTPAGIGRVSLQPPGYPGLLGAEETNRCSDEGSHSPSASTFLLSIYFVLGTFWALGLSSEQNRPGPYFGLGVTF